MTGMVAEPEGAAKRADGMAGHAPCHGPCRYAVARDRAGHDKEGAVTGMCVERPVTLLVEGQALQATAFTTNPLRASTEGPVSPRFVESLARGAAAAGLPAEWVASLKAPPA